MNAAQALETLGFSSLPDLEALEASYRDLCKVWHPDRFSEEDQRLRSLAAEKTTQLNLAYEVLQDCLANRANENNEHLGGLGKDESTPIERSQVFLASGLLLLLIGLSIYLGRELGGIVVRSIDYFSRETEEVRPDEWQAANSSVISPKASRMLVFEAPNFSPEEKVTEKEIVPALSREEFPVSYPIPLEEMSAPKRKDVMFIVTNEGKVSEEVVNFTPDLIEAAVKCQLKRLGNLLDGGQSIEVKDERGDTALVWAVRSRCFEAVKFLVDRGAEVNVSSWNGFTPYVWARVYQRDDIAKFLAGRGADTKRGSYWWRNSKEERSEWLARSLGFFCKSDKC